MYRTHWERVMLLDGYPLAVDVVGCRVILAEGVATLRLRASAS
jgi:hypothetical protein